MATVKQPISHSYWRSIKGGRRTYESIPDELKDDVRTLARTDVANGVIRAEAYAAYIGEDYVA